ncbi:MAG: type II toxin-antitoxin system RelE family toxin [Syntrophobacteraceae bacterium]
MASYRVLFSKSIRQDVRGIDKAQLSRIMDSIRTLAENPFPSGCKRLKGARSSYRIRVGRYRVVYEVEVEAATVTIFRIRHRKVVYR